MMANEIDFQPRATGDIDAYYVNRHGARLHGFIWLSDDSVTIGITGLGTTVTRPFGRRAAADLAINVPAYRAKVIATARAELERQFAAVEARY